MTPMIYSTCSCVPGAVNTDTHSEPLLETRPEGLRLQAYYADKQFMRSHTIRSDFVCESMPVDELSKSNLLLLYY